MNIKTDVYNVVEVEDVIHRVGGLTPGASIDNSYRFEDNKGLMFQLSDNNSNEKLDTIIQNTIKGIFNDIVKTRIYTDGEIVNIEIEYPRQTDEYNVGKKKHNGGPNTFMIRKRIYITNASYVLKVTTAREFLRAGKVNGFFDVLKETEIFLNNKKDKQALRNAKKTIQKFSGQPHFDSIFDAIMQNYSSNSGSINKNLNYDSINKNVYQLRK